MYFQRKCRLKFFLPYSPMLTQKTKMRNKKSKMENFEKQKKNVLEI